MTAQTTGQGRGGTRERILLLLRRHGRRSAPQLAKQLDLSVVGIRRHLVALERDGLVEASVEKPARGRPAALYRLTDAGLETFPRHYDELAAEALSFLGAADGRALHAFLAWRNEQLAARYSPRVSGADVAERARHLADALSEQGFMAEVEQTPDGLRLCQHNCTVEHIAAAHPDVCTSEAALFERLLGTSVVREATIVGGAVRCVTSVAPAASPRRPGPRLARPGTDPARPAGSPTNPAARSTA
ncbi:MAG TPA: helix-turn-helix domain-containing protein [Actinomycetes bacterium]|nr:helix-turn-helix domain-containing protein [Actinomycetes bacterium]